MRLLGLCACSAWCYSLPSRLVCVPSSLFCLLGLCTLSARALFIPCTFSAFAPARLGATYFCRALFFCLLVLCDIFACTSTRLAPLVSRAPSRLMRLVPSAPSWLVRMFGWCAFSACAPDLHSVPYCSRAFLECSVIAPFCWFRFVGLCALCLVHLLSLCAFYFVHLLGLWALYPVKLLGLCAFFSRISCGLASLLAILFSSTRGGTTTVTWKLRDTEV